MAKYRVNKPKAYEDGKMIPVGHVFDVADGEEVPAFLVGKVELVPEELVEAEDVKKAATDPAKK